MSGFECKHGTGRKSAIGCSVGGVFGSTVHGTRYDTNVLVRRCSRDKVVAPLSAVLLPSHGYPAIHQMSDATRSGLTGRVMTSMTGYFLSTRDELHRAGPYQPDFFSSAIHSSRTPASRCRRFVTINRYRTKLRMEARNCDRESESHASRLYVACLLLTYFLGFDNQVVLYSSMRIMADHPQGREVYYIPQRVARRMHEHSADKCWRLHDDNNRAPLVNEGQWTNIYTSLHIFRLY